MKIYVFALLVMAAVAFARQLPVEDLNKDEVPLDILYLPLASEDESSPVEHHRERRFTCNNNACNAHCIVRNRKGGYCNDKNLCVCRK
ncbi:defensin-like [Temnothorax curvispinosus]|uniref:Defensin-like n=1 Tax=Temnothorax curvispinosus TaxID=300111 RepID=A0A6J1R3N9_9HYME|nr:defensin-like [Temnothorax curvispinosus]